MTPISRLPLSKAYKDLVDQAETQRQMDMRPRGKGSSTHDIAYFIPPNRLCDAHVCLCAQAIFNEMAGQNALFLITYDQGGKKSASLPDGVRLWAKSSYWGRAHGEGGLEINELEIESGQRLVSLSNIEHVRLGKVANGCKLPYIHLAIKGYTTDNRLIQLTGHCGEASPAARL